MKRSAAAAAAFTSDSTFPQWGFNHSYFLRLVFAINLVQLGRQVEKYGGGAAEELAAVEAAYQQGAGGGCLW